MGRPDQESRRTNPLQKSKTKQTSEGPVQPTPSSFPFPSSQPPSSPPVGLSTSTTAFQAEVESSDDRTSRTSSVVSSDSEDEQLVNDSIIGAWQNALPGHSPVEPASSYVPSKATSEKQPATTPALAVGRGRLTLPTTSSARGKLTSVTPAARLSSAARSKHKPASKPVQVSSPTSEDAGHSRPRAASKQSFSGSEEPNAVSLQSTTAQLQAFGSSDKLISQPLPIVTIQTSSLPPNGSEAPAVKQPSQQSASPAVIEGVKSITRDTSDSDSSSESEEETAADFLSAEQQVQVAAAPPEKQDTMRRNFIGKLGSALSSFGRAVVAGPATARASSEKPWYSVPDEDDEPVCG